MYPTLALLNTAFATVRPAADQDGQSFDYRTALQHPGLVAIDGKRVEDGTAFSLRVDHNGRVSGEVAGTRVSFWVSAAAHRRLVAGLGEDQALAA